MKLKKIVTGVVLCGILTCSVGRTVAIAIPKNYSGYRVTTGSMYYSYTTTPGTNSAGKMLKI